MGTLSGPFDLPAAIAEAYGLAMPVRPAVVPDDDQRCVSCGHLPGCDCPHDCESAEDWSWRG